MDIENNGRNGLFQSLSAQESSATPIKGSLDNGGGNGSPQVVHGLGTSPVKDNAIPSQFRIGDRGG